MKHHQLTATNAQPGGWTSEIAVGSVQPRIAVSFGDSTSKVCVVDEYRDPRAGEFDRELLHEPANDLGEEDLENVILTDSTSEGGDGDCSFRGVELPEVRGLSELATDTDSLSAAPSTVDTVE